MSSQVFGITLRSNYRENLPQKLLRLLKALSPEELVAERSKWAIKIHFGERGSHAFIRPNLVRVFVDAIKSHKAEVYLTDTNTLYIGYRTNSVNHIETAILNGFDYAVVGAPIIIADGLAGENSVPVPVEGGILKEAWIAGDLLAADGVLALSHLKGHELTGFGGTLKNLAMGGASRRGKMAQHSDLSPSVTAKKCTGCGTCLSSCAQKAISVSAKKAKIDPVKCVGCALCIPVCPEGAINPQFGRDGERFMKKMIEYARAALHGKGKNTLFVNFITNVSPLCDCYNHSDAPIVADLGVLASRDPVALDHASAVLVNQAQGLPGSCLKEGLAPGADKWKALHPSCDWEFQLEYAEKLGMGQRKYKLTWLPEAKGVE